MTAYETMWSRCEMSRSWLWLFSVTCVVMPGALVDLHMTTHRSLVDRATKRRGSRLCCFDSRARGLEHLNSFSGVVTSSLAQPSAPAASQESSSCEARVVSAKKTACSDLCCARDLQLFPTPALLLVPFGGACKLRSPRFTERTRMKHEQSCRAVSSEAVVISNCEVHEVLQPNGHQIRQSIHRAHRPRTLWLTVRTVIIQTLST